MAQGTLSSLLNELNERQHCQEEENVRKDLHRRELLSGEIKKPQTYPGFKL